MLSNYAQKSRILNKVWKYRTGGYKLTAYFDLLKRFGWRMWGSFIVGSLAASIPMVILMIILVFAIIAIGVSSVIGAGAVDPFSDPDALFSTIFSGGTIIMTILFMLFFFFVSLLTSAFTSAGSTGVVSETIQEGRATIGAYFRYGFRRLFPMLGLSLVLFLLAIPPAIPLVIGIVLFAVAETWSIILGVICLLLTILAYIIYSLIVMHAPAILIAEQQGVFASIAGSFRAFQKRFGEVILSGLILLGISIVGGVATMLLSWVIGGMNPFDFESEPNPFRSLLSSILMVPINAGLQLVIVFTLVFRYLHVIKTPPTGGTEAPALVGPNADDPVPEQENNTQQPPYQEP